MDLKILWDCLLYCSLEGMPGKQPVVVSRVLNIMLYSGYVLYILCKGPMPRWKTNQKKVAIGPNLMPTRQHEHLQCQIQYIQYAETLSPSRKSLQHTLFLPFFNNADFYLTKSIFLYLTFFSFLSQLVPNSFRLLPFPICSSLIPP